MSPARASLRRTLRATILVATLGLVAVAMVACDSFRSDDGGNNNGDYRTVEALAPIDELDVRFAESFPVQHFLHIVSGLPSGCAAFERVDVERNGTTFNIEVWNTVPHPDDNVACTAIYGFHESNVALGSDLEVGTEYTVNVNDKTITFVAQ